MSTGESTEEIPTDDAITRLRFRLDGLRERVKQIWAAMHGGDPDAPRDYDPFADERRFYQRLLKEQRSGPGHGGVSGNSWSTWILGVVGAVIAAGILGLTSAMFRMTERVASLETKMDMLVAKDRRP